MRTGLIRNFKGLRNFFFVYNENYIFTYNIHEIFLDFYKILSIFKRHPVYFIGFIWVYKNSVWKDIKLQISEIYYEIECKWMNKMKSIGILIQENIFIYDNQKFYVVQHSSSTLINFSSVGEPEPGSGPF